MLKRSGAFVAVFLFMALVRPAVAGGPVVCRTGSGSILTQYYLSYCVGVPTDIPVYVQLKIKSTGSGSANATLVDGMHTCTVTASPESAQVAECAITVRDGHIEQVQVNNSENYRMLMSWTDSDYGSYGGYGGYGSYTQTLTSGGFFTIERSFTYGERAIGWLLVFIAAFILLIVVMMALIIRRV